MTSKLFGIGLVVAILSLLGSTTAGATTSGSAPRFASQAAAAGLSPSQANALQRRLAGYLAVNKGSQVAFNKIDLNGTGEIDLAYPGQVHPDFTCYVGDFCGYALPNRNASGDHFSKSACNSRVTIPGDDGWVGNGSWWNNQTGGVRAKFYDSAGHLYFTTPAAVSYDNSYNWTPVYSIIAC